MTIVIEQQTMDSASRTLGGNLRQRHVEQAESQHEASESFRRVVGANALDANGKEIPNSGHWKDGPTLADQIWPQSV
jgi:hypothetical protein